MLAELGTQDRPPLSPASWQIRALVTGPYSQGQEPRQLE